MNYEELEQKYIQIPQEIKQTKRWVCYKTEIRDGYETKIPTNAISGGYASTSDPNTWTSFKLALKGCAKYGFSGLGFMLGENKITGETFFGVDLDNHVDKVTGKKPYETSEEFKEFAYIFINTLNSYTEYSHSGEGVHIICKGKLPAGARKSKGVEMYDYRRFFTMTGNIINNVPIKDCEEEIKPLWEKYLNEPSMLNNINNVSYQGQGFERQPQIVAKVNERGGITFEEAKEIEVSSSVNMSDYELIEKIRNSQHGRDFMRLYNGDMSDYGNDHSAADMALCKILAFWTGCDAERMDRIFRQSALIRGKWERRWGESTYGRKTIESAIATQRDVYTPAPKVEKIIIPVKTDNGSPIQPQGDIVEFDEKNDPIVKIKKVFKTYSLTDTGNAERFYDYFGEYFRYDTKAKMFLFWNGKTWTYDSKIYIKKYADILIEVLKTEIKETEQKIRDILKAQEENENEPIDIISDGEGSETTNLNNWDVSEYTNLLKAQRDNLKRVSNKAGKEAMIVEFQHLHEISVVTEEFDTQEYYLNTDSGVVDLRDGKIIPFDRKYKLSKNTQVMVSYEEPKTFIKFLHDIFKRPNEGETEEIIDTVQMFFGGALLGRTNKDSIGILWGNGSNGKSTFVKVMKKAFGEYGKTVNPELLLQQKNGSMQSTEFAFASLKGARLLTMSETDEGERMSDKTIKKLTSGEEISAQKKFGDQFEFEPTFTPVMSTNNLPAIRSKDYGIWRRIFLIPFLVKFTDETKDIHMPEKLSKELPQILGWLIQGCLKLNKEHNGVIPKPKCLEEALSDYKNNMDVVNLYIASNCQNFPGYKTGATRLFQDYKMWARNNNEYDMSESKFKADMISHGFTIKKDATEGWVYVGIKLNSDKKGHDFALDLEEEEESN